MFRGWLSVCLIIHFLFLQLISWVWFWFVFFCSVCWLARFPRQEIPKAWVASLSNLSVLLGISEFANSPEKVSDYISPLLSFAAEHVPRAKHKETPLYILCTAGMRILPERLLAVLFLVFRIASSVSLAIFNCSKCNFAASRRQYLKICSLIFPCILIFCFRTHTQRLFQGSRKVG